MCLSVAEPNSRTGWQQASLEARVAPRLAAGVRKVNNPRGTIANSSEPSYSGEAGAGGQDPRGGGRDDPGDGRDNPGGGRDNPGGGRDSPGPSLLAILVAHGFNLFCLHPSCKSTILTRPIV